jgi:plastocyanin
MLSLALTACSSGGGTKDAGASTPAPAAGPPAVIIKTTEFAFIMPDTIPAGLTTLRIENVGGMPHFLEFQAVGQGKTDADIQAYLDSPKAQNSQPSWISPAHLPSIGLVSPGVATDITFDLPPGRYGVFCWMPDANGTPHGFLGMHKVFEVTGDPSSGAQQLPASDLTLTATDGLPTVPDSIPVGTATVGYVNSGSKRGSVSIARVLVDKPIDQVQKLVNAWFGSGYAGPPPVEFLGGIGGIPTSAEAAGTSTVNFVPGVYAFVGQGNQAVIRDVGGGGFPPVASPTVSGVAACGAATATQQITAQNFAFDQACLAVPADAPFTVMFDNQDADAPHNMAILQGPGSPKALFTGELVVGPKMTTYNVDAIPAGTYIFRCDVHPATMTGTLVVG